MFGIREKKTASMIFFITFLRALAACIITNAHYTGIYPTDMIANGGLIGDVLFFSVSGFCLYNVKNKLSPLSVRAGKNQTVSGAAVRLRAIILNQKIMRDKVSEKRKKFGG